MPSLFFPQLSTGTLVQYPVKRKKTIRVVSTQAEDGSIIQHFDANGSLLSWELIYAGLTQDEVSVLQGLFDSCCGTLRSFTFLDPVGNLLGSQWQYGPTVQMNGSTYTNIGNAPEEISQTAAVPANYFYTFSISGSISADPTATLTLIRRGPNTEQQTVAPLNQAVLVSSGALTDSGVGLTVAIQLQPGQSINFTQAQLEAQPVLSPFQPASGGVYPQAHWAQNELVFTATAPNCFSSKFTIETHI